MLFFTFMISLTALAVLTYEVYVRSKSDARLERLIRTINNQQVCQSRDLDQLRYVVASVRNAMSGEDVEAEVSEEDFELKMLEDAVAEMEKVSTAISPSSDGEEQTVSVSDDKAGPEWKISPESTGDKLSDDRILALIKDAIKNNNIDIKLQPILAIKNKIVRHYEAFSRIRAGESGYISAGRFMSLAGNENMIPILDNLILLRCLQLIKSSQGGDVSRAFFVNISTSSLLNANFMSSLLKYLEKNPRLASRIIFEVRQVELHNNHQELKPVIDELSMLGVRLSVDNVDDFKLDMQKMLEVNVSFVKLNSEKLHELQQSNKTESTIRKMKDVLEGNGIELIGEKVENKQQMQAIQDLGLIFGQGYFLGAPR